MAQAATNDGSNRIQRRKERVQAAIVEGAEQQFLEKGYASTTLEAIAQSADVGVGTIYSYFSGKSDLFLAVLERELDMVESYQEAAFNPDLSPRQQLIAVGESYLRFASDHPRHFRLLNLISGEIAEDDADASVMRRKIVIDTRVAKIIGRQATVIQQIIVDSDPTLMDAEQIARFLWGAWNGVIALYLQNNAHHFDTEAARVALAQGRRLLIAGVEALLDNSARYEW